MASTRCEYFPQLACLADEHPLEDLDGAALVTQLHAHRSEGSGCCPQTLTTEVQVRLFEKKPDGAFKRTSIQVSEISRRLLVTTDPSGGLIVENENSPAYLAVAGNDYTFASPQPPFRYAGSGRSFAHGARLATEKISATVMTFAFTNYPRPSHASRPATESPRPPGRGCGNGKES